MLSRALQRAAVAYLCYKIATNDNVREAAGRFLFTYGQAARNDIERLRQRLFVVGDA